MAIKIPDELIFLKNSKAPQKKCTESLQGKICVISGATSGVGFETLKALSKGGAHCVMVARNSAKAKKIKAEIDEAYSTDTDMVIADFASFGSVRSAADIIAKKYPIIDVLINSAGVHSTRRIITEDGNELTFQVNHLSSLLLAQLLLDNIKKSVQGRIVQVNSQGHRFGGLNINDLTWKKRPYMGLRSYGASKIAQLICVQKMAEELQDTNVTINAMHPGAVKTSIGNNNGTLYRFYNKHFIYPSLGDPQISGEAIYYLSADKSLIRVRGKFFNLTILEPPASYVINRKYYDQVYPISKNLCGLK